MFAHPYGYTSSVTGPPYSIQPVFELLQRLVVAATFCEHTTNGEDSLYNMLRLPYGTTK